MTPASQSFTDALRVPAITHESLNAETFPLLVGEAHLLLDQRDAARYWATQLEQEAHDAQQAVAAVARVRAVLKQGGSYRLGERILAALDGDPA